MLKLRTIERTVSPQALDASLATYARLKPTTARRVLEFHRKRAQHG